MTNAVRAFKLTIPGGGAVGTLTSVPVNLGPSIVSKIIVLFPPGCAGNVGVLVSSGGAQLYPKDAGTYFTFDDYPLEVPVVDQIDSGSWAVSGYNIDFYQHVVTAYFFFDYLTDTGASGSSVLASLGG
jgi:hypothetical protein